jgi:TPR repeat protein
MSEHKLIEITEFLDQAGFTYISKLNDFVIDQVHDLFFEGIIPDTDDDVINMFIAIYYNIIDDSEKMIEYDLKSIAKGNSDAMCNLGCYYADKDKEKSRYYHLMAIEHGNEEAKKCTHY